MDMQIRDWALIFTGIVALSALIWNIINTIMDRRARLKLSIWAGTFTEHFGTELAKSERQVGITGINLGLLPVTVEEGGLIYPLLYSWVRIENRMQRRAFVSKHKPSEESALYPRTLNYGEKVEYFAVIDEVRKGLLQHYGKARYGIRYYVRDSTGKYHKRTIPRKVIDTIFTVQSDA